MARVSSALPLCNFGANRCKDFRAASFCELRTSHQGDSGARYLEYSAQWAAMAQRLEESAHIVINNGIGQIQGVAQGRR